MMIIPSQHTFLFNTHTHTHSPTSFIRYIREPLVPGEDRKKNQREMEEKTHSHDASRPKVVVAELLCEVANAISWLESQEPLWKRSHGRALLLCRLFSRSDALKRDSTLSLQSGSRFRFNQSPMMSSMDGLRLMERAMVRNEIHLDGQSVLDPDLDSRRVRFCLSNFFEALPGEASNGILVVTYVDVKAISLSLCVYFIFFQRVV